MEIAENDLEKVLEKIRQVSPKVQFHLNDDNSSLSKPISVEEILVLHKHNRLIYRDGIPRLVVKGFLDDVAGLPGVPQAMLVLLD